jgi:hypothetical protein
MRTSRFDEVVQAIVRALVQEHDAEAAGELAPKVAEFVRGQHARMPDFLRGPLQLLTLALDTWPWFLGYGRPLRRLTPGEARLVLATWRTGWPTARRDLVSFYEVLSVFGLAAERQERGRG